ncbi:hypothetical protein K438DRAFT_1757825 [Mycena galopus ATCC 62051]|nr:hypothetical protein K438DRAFT_1757825 [Mycena galopus ATCC 62051]
MPGFSPWCKHNQSDTLYSYPENFAKHPLAIPGTFRETGTNWGALPGPRGATTNTGSSPCPLVALGQAEGKGRGGGVDPVFLHSYRRREWPVSQKQIGVPSSPSTAPQDGLPQSSVLRVRAWAWRCRGGTHYKPARSWICEASSSPATTDPSAVARHPWKNAHSDTGNPDCPWRRRGMHCLEMERRFSVKTVLIRPLDASKVSDPRQSKVTDLTTLRHLAEKDIPGEKATSRASDERKPREKCNENYLDSEKAVQTARLLGRLRELVAVKKRKGPIARLPRSIDKSLRVEVDENAQDEGSEFDLTRFLTEAHRTCAQGRGEEWESETKQSIQQPEIFRMRCE